MCVHTHPRFPLQLIISSVQIAPSRSIHLITPPILASIGSSLGILTYCFRSHTFRAILIRSHSGASIMDNQFESQSGIPMRTHASRPSSHHLSNAPSLPDARPITMSQPFTIANLTLGLLNLVCSIIGLALMGQYSSYQIRFLHRILYLLFVRFHPYVLTVVYKISHSNDGNTDLTNTVIGYPLYPLAPSSVYYTCPPETQSLDLPRRKCGRASCFMPVRDSGGRYVVLASLGNHRGGTARLYSGC